MVCGSERRLHLLRWDRHRKVCRRWKTKWDWRRRHRWKSRLRRGRGKRKLPSPVEHLLDYSSDVGRIYVREVDGRKRRVLLKGKSVGSRLRSLRRKVRQVLERGAIARHRLAILRRIAWVKWQAMRRRRRWRRRPVGHGRLNIDSRVRLRVSSYKSRRQSTEMDDLRRR